MKRKKRAPNATDIQVGEAIRAHRLIAGMSQQALAERLDVSFQQVQKYEKGTNRVGAGRLPQIAKILNVPISALFDPHANASPGARAARAVPVALIPDKSALQLLNSFAGITNSAIRRGLVDLAGAIAKASLEKKTKGRDEPSA